MAKIPTYIAQRSLDTGNVVQYPSGSPIGAAVESAGNAMQAVAARFQQMKEQQDKFDTGIIDDELRASLAAAETDALLHAPADGSGLHDTVYGQIDPATNEPVKPGIFDTIFGKFAGRVPESQRRNFEAQKNALRTQGSTRLAGVQYKTRLEYENVEAAKTEDRLINDILQADPDDPEAYERFRKAGVERLSTMTDPLERDKRLYSWEQKSAKALAQAMINKDPTAVKALLGMKEKAPTGSGAISTVVDRIIGVESGGSATAKNPRSSAEGLGQFIDSTWLRVIKQYRPDIAAGKSAAQILALKTDPGLSRQMTEAYTNENAEYLKNRGVATTPGNLYLAHFAGAGGAVQIMKADPGASVASVLGQDKVRANPFLAGMTAADLQSWASKKMGGGTQNVAPDPRLAALSPEDRLILANQADVETSQRANAMEALQKAEYTSYKNRFEHDITNGKIRDEAIINADTTLNDGDKSTLIRLLRTQNETINQISTDLAALNGGDLKLDAYSSEGKKRADNLFNEALKSVPAEQQGALATSIIQQTGVVPAPVVNTIRKGLSSTDPAQVATAAQMAQRIAAMDPAALSRRDGGTEVQKTADDFSYFVNKLNLSPDEAARRLIDLNDPEKKLARKALEPAAKEFVKSLTDVNLASEFGADTLGANPQQELSLQAEFVALAEDQFYAANGDPELAKANALKQMGVLYGTTEFGPSKTLMKHPPERYWPKQRLQGMGAWLGDPYQYARTQLYNDIVAIDPDYQPNSIQLVTTPETDAMVKRGELPGYSVLYKDANGVLQTIPGKLWRPDPSRTMEIDQSNVDAERARNEAIARDMQAEELRKAQLKAMPDAGRGPALDAFIEGPNAVPQPDLNATAPGTSSTLRDKLDDRRQELFENAPDPTTSFGGAL